MPATWNDFVYVNAATGNSAGTLSVSNVQPNDLIIAVCSAYNTARNVNLGQPVFIPGGVSTEVIHEQNIVPFEVDAIGGWSLQWYTYWRNWWGNFCPTNWLYQVYRCIGRVVIYKAASAGTVNITFQPGNATTPIFKTHLVVWRPSISVGSNETVVNITYAPSAQPVRSEMYALSMPVRTDDLLLGSAMGMDVPSLNPSISGVTVQNLLNYTAEYAGVRQAVQMWRVKTPGTATYTLTNANVSQHLAKIIPSVEVGHVTIPSVPPEANYFYVEIGADLLSNGRVVRPKWFEDLRTTYAWNNNLGLRKRWVKGTAMGVVTGRARLVELWKVPKGAETSIPSGAAYVFTSDQDAEARVLFHDLGW